MYMTKAAVLKTVAFVLVIKRNRELCKKSREESEYSLEEG